MTLSDKRNPLLVDIFNCIFTGILAAFVAYFLTSYRSFKRLQAIKAEQINNDLKLIVNKSNLFKDTMLGSLPINDDKE